MVMKKLWAMMLNRRARPGSDEVLKRLQIKAGHVIADIGSGGGYYSFRFSELVAPGGKVYAVDTDRILLEHLIREAGRRGLTNIKALDGQDIRSLPGESLDLVFLRNVFHHLAEPQRYFQDLGLRLKPLGKIAIIEWSPSSTMRDSHCTAEETILEVLRGAGYFRTDSYDFLRGQTYNIFQKQITD